MTHITYFNVGSAAFNQTKLDSSFWFCIFPLCTPRPVLFPVGKTLALLGHALFWVAPFAVGLVCATQHVQTISDPTFTSLPDTYRHAVCTTDAPCFDPSS